jgi:SRSO17 transposase
VTPTQLRRIRTRLGAFAEDLFESIPCKDQRRWGQSYLRGLLLDGKRKSIQPMAAWLTKGDPQADADALEQALQQFANQSPWDPVPVGRRLAQRMTAAIHPQAWVIADTAFPKFGRHSVGVAPQYCGGAGQGRQLPGRRERARRHRPGLLPDRLAAVPPQSWDDDAQRRCTAHVPADQRHRPKWRLALDMLDELAGWDLVPPVILADGADGEVGGFRLGLEQRELACVVQVPGTISAYPEDVAPELAAYAGRGRPPVPRYLKRRSWLRQLVLDADPRRPRRWPGAKALTASRCARGLSPCGSVRLESGCAAPPVAESCRCAGCWPSGPQVSPSRSPTGWPPCPPRSPCSSWWVWPGCAGESSTTTGN